MMLRFPSGELTLLQTIASLGRTNASFTSHPRRTKTCYLDHFPGLTREGKDGNLISLFWSHGAQIHSRWVFAAFGSTNKPSELWHTKQSGTCRKRQCCDAHSYPKCQQGGRGTSSGTSEVQRHMARTSSARTNTNSTCGGVILVPVDMNRIEWVSIQTQDKKKKRTARGNCSLHAASRTTDELQIESLADGVTSHAAIVTEETGSLLYRKMQTQEKFASLFI
ncbi:hypothetical protein VTI28DRAFT_1696 [Corynascus sepedonium]